MVSGDTVLPFFCRKNGPQPTRQLITKLIANKDHQQFASRARLICPTHRLSRWAGQRSIVVYCGKKLGHEPTKFDHQVSVQIQIGSWRLRTYKRRIRIRDFPISPQKSTSHPSAHAYSRSVLHLSTVLLHVLQNPFFLFAMKIFLHASGIKLQRHARV